MKLCQPLLGRMGGGKGAPVLQIWRQGGPLLVAQSHAVLLSTQHTHTHMPGIPELKEGGSLENFLVIDISHSYLSRQIKDKGKTQVDTNNEDKSGSQLQRASVLHVRKHTCFF